MNTPQFFIYALVDPRDQAVRYIGKSSTGMRRPLLHRRPSCLRVDKTHKANWIRALLAEGLTYTVEILQVVGSANDLDEAERYWIREAREHGWRLTNHTDGGDGLTGAVFSAEHRARISAANKGRKLTDEQYQRFLSAVRNRPAATRDTSAASRSNVGRKHTAETKAKIGAVHRGKKLSADQLAALSAANSKPVKELGSGCVFPSARAAADVLNLEYSGVSKVAAGKGRLKSIHGFRFMYLP